MRRQLNGSRPPYKPSNTPLPKENGGSGAKTPIAAMAALGGIHVSQLGLQPGQIAQLDETGALPVSVFSNGNGSPVGLSISGPKTLAYGQDGRYIVTNAADYTDVVVGVSAGSVVFNEDIIVVAAPSEGDYIDLSIGIRTIRIPLVSAYIEKPTIILPATGYESLGTVAFKATPFYSEPETFGAATWVLRDNQTYALAASTSSFTLSGRSGDAGTAYIIYDGVRYDMGKGQTERVVRRGINSSLTWGVTGTGSLGLEENTAVNPHTHTEWEISDSLDFVNIVWATTQYATTNPDLTSVIATELPPGAYYVRCRYINRQELPT